MHHCPVAFAKTVCLFNLPGKSNLYTGAEQEQKVKPLAASLSAQQNHLLFANKAQASATGASPEIAQLITQHRKNLLQRVPLLK